VGNRLYNDTTSPDMARDMRRLRNQVDGVWVWVWMGGKEDSVQELPTKAKELKYQE
jgi:hypothetical protein